MNYKKKKQIVNKFNEKREESDIIANTCLKLPFGKNNTITIEELPWLEAEKFEKKFMQIIQTMMKTFDTEIDTENMVKNIKSKGVEEILNILVTKLLGDDLISIATIITEGKATKQYIIDNKVTKNQVIRLVAEGVGLNYSYLKNLAPLVQTLYGLK